MGIRLSLWKASKKIENRLALWPDDDEDGLNNFIRDNTEKMLYDFCTDAMYDLSDKWVRLTIERFEFEGDFMYGKMREKEFLEFMTAVKARAAKIVKEASNGNYRYPNGELVLPFYFDSVKIPNKESSKWELCFSIDWVSAYYQCLYIHKIFDWWHDFIIWELS